MKTQTLRRTKLTSLSNSRWTAYATAGAASAIAGINTAEADIHYSGTVNQVMNAPASSTALATFNLTGGAQLRFAYVRASTGHPSSHGSALFRIQGAAVSNMFAGSAAGAYRYPFNLAAGANISAQAFVAHNGAFFASMAVHGGFTNSHFLAAGTGFIGFRFNTGAGIQYGWARVTMSGAPDNHYTVVDYAWGDVGQAIVAGQTTAVPEPGSLGLLAVGAAGLVLWRRSRAKAA